MRNGTRGRYTLEFKQEAVRLVESGQSVAEAARNRMEAALMKIDDALALKNQAPPRPNDADVSDDPRDYGVTITVDVKADSPEESTEMFIEKLGISNTEGLTFHVSNLHSGMQWEF